MATLYGRLQGNRGEVTRTGSKHIHAQVETWSGKVRVDLDADGNFEVTVGPKGWGGRTVLKGNIDQPEQPVEFVETEVAPV
jgi:hypothetical protein